MTIFPAGLSKLAIGGTIGITIGYLFLRASAAKEFMPVVAWVAGAAILGYGLATRGSLTNWPETKLMVGGLLSGVIMYSLYDLTVRLYKVMDVSLKRIIFSLIMRVNRIKLEI